MTPPPSGPRDWSPFPGPRDWSPPPKSRRTNKGPATTRRRTGVAPDQSLSRNGAAWWSAFLGLAALALALIQPGYTSIGQGFIVSTVGISAIAYGIYALASGRRRTTRIVVPLAGVAMGSVGTFIMVFYFTTFIAANPNMAWGAVPGDDDPLIRVEVSLGEPTPASAPNPAAPDSGQGLAVPFIPGQPEVPPPNIETIPIRDVMHMTAQSIAAGMNLATLGNPWPSALIVTTDDQSVIMPTGEGVGRLPRGLQLDYQPSADLTHYTLVITDPVTGGSVEYSTLTGVVTDR
jgi:hypothetical protein